VNEQVAFRALESFPNRSRILDRNRDWAHEVQVLLRRHAQSEVWDRQPRRRTFEEALDYPETEERVAPSDIRFTQTARSKKFGARAAQLTDESGKPSQR
jgi:hypothetical protein